MVLLDKKRISAQSLADMFEVSLRTIYRDIDAIDLAGIPIRRNVQAWVVRGLLGHTLTGKEGRWRPDSRIPAWCPFTVSVDGFAPQVGSIERSGA